MTFYHAQVKQMTRELFPDEVQTEQIIRSRKFIHDHFSDEMNLARVSGAAFYSRFHFIRLFRKHYGLTPMQYLTNIRIGEAKKLLKAGHSVSAICCQLGFESTTSFAALFKKHTGKTPSAFKKAIFNR